MKPRILSLFAGIGCLERAVEIVTGGESVTQVEAVPYRRAVLAKHWPAAERFDDVVKYTSHEGSHDIICGGFPCRDISALGSKLGLDGKKSGLWSEYRRLIEEIKPNGIFIENVQALRIRGLDRVLQDLAFYGYDAVWTCTKANETGCHVQRARLFLLAVPASAGRIGGAPVWLSSPHIREGQDINGRCFHVPRPSDRAGDQGYDGPEPGLYRAALGNPRGVVARHVRERNGALGDTVSIPQAVHAYTWCVEQLRRAYGL